MKNYRIVRDGFLGYEAQVRYAWFPFVWFQMNDFYWINTWPTAEHARHFIDQKRSGAYSTRHTHAGDNSQAEYEKEVKLLIFQGKNFTPEVVWTEPKEQPVTRRRWWPAFTAINS